MAVGEVFMMKKAVEMGGVTIFKAIKSCLIFLAFAGICYCIYVTVVKPHTSGRLDTTTEHIEKKVEYNYSNPDDSFFIGVKLFNFKFGISKQKRIDIKEKEIVEK